MRRFVSIAAVATVVVLLGGESFLYGQEIGILQGRVTDKFTREGLPSATIVVKGTYYGAAADFDGNYAVQKINAGTYVVEVKLLGYKAMQFSAVKINSGETTTLNVELEETSLSLGQEVVIIGEKPLFNIEETASRRSLKSEDLTAAAVQNISDVVAMQVGVVKSDDQIHIRGGRSYEASVLVDGIPIQDPLAGTGFGLNLPPGAIQEVEVITGGYNAEYGQATSGVVSFTTKEGSDTYSGTIAHKRDHLGFNAQSRSNFNTDILEVSLGGPEPLTSTLLPALGVSLPGKISFFVNANMHLTDGYTRWVEKTNELGQPAGYILKTPGGLTSDLLHTSSLSPRRSNNWSSLAKLTWKLTPTIKLSYTNSYSLAINQNTQTIQTTLERAEPQPGYQFYFQNIPDSANTFTQINIQHAFQMTHTLGSKTFYELRLSNYSAHVRGDANGRYWTTYLEPKDVVSFPVIYYNTGHDTVGVIPGDGFYEMGSPNVWRDHFVNEWTLKFDVTSNFDEKNKFKAGIEMRYQHMQMVDIISPWIRPLGYNNDIYSVDPALGAIYAQDNLSAGGMILNFGLRFDYWFPGNYVDEAVRNEERSLVSPVIRAQYLRDTYSFFGRRWKGRMSPRVAIAHPVSDNQTLFFSYGHFSKFPRPQFVYSKLVQSNARSTFQVIGNPNLNPETTVAYELGLRNQLTENDVLSVTAYYKDIFDYITAKSVRVQQTRFSAGSYTTYINLDYARSRGIEIEYKTRYSTWFRATASGSYSISTGKSSSATEAVFNIQQGLEENVKETYLVWDRPLQGTLIFNLRAPKDEDLLGLGRGVFNDASIFMKLFFQSGRRYTPQVYVGEDYSTRRPIYRSDYNNPYSRVGRDILTLDVNMEKSFDLNFARLVLTLEIKNILDRKNAQILNPVTGNAYAYGDQTPNSWNDPMYPDLQAPVDPYPYNPARYMEPRSFRAGLAVRF
jgi:outer membrane receptor protein involved in Fe transport